MGNIIPKKTLSTFAQVQLEVKWGHSPVRVRERGYIQLAMLVAVMLHAKCSGR